MSVRGLTRTHVHWIFESATRGGFETVGIVEPNRDLARRFSEQHGFDMALVYDSIGEILEAARRSAATGETVTLDR